MSRREPATPDFRSILASVDRSGRRRHVEGRIVWGWWRRRRAALAAVLIAFYLALPFIHIAGRPFLRIDVPGLRATIAGHLFGPQDLVFVVLAVLILVIGIMLTTAIAGRVFCGWLCPHSVFLEMVFRPIEALCERGGKRGDPLRKGLKWLIFILIAGALANTLTAVFIGTEGYLYGVFVNPITHPIAALFFLGFFSFALFDFGWFREQACTIVCPYGRLQSIMIDAHTPVVAYDRTRGEPRGKVNTPGAGDCVDCRKCVSVCPTGIDIRDGNQLECLHCTGCIDACDSIMLKLGREPGLIRFSSEQATSGKPVKKMRARTLIYAGALALLLVTSIAWTNRRTDLDAVVLRSDLIAVAGVDEHGPVARQVVRMVLTNHSDIDRTPRFSVPSIGGIVVIPQRPDQIVPAGKRVEMSLIVVTPLPLLTTDRLIDIQVSGGEAPILVPIMVRKP